MEYEMWQNDSLTLLFLLLKYRKSGNIMENKLHILTILPCAILFLLFTCFCLLLTPTNPTDYWYTVFIPKKSHDVTEQDITIRQDVEVWTMKCELWFLSVLKASYSPDCLFLVEGQRISGWWCSLLQSQGMRPFPKSLPSLSLQWPYINSKCALRYFLWHFAGQKKERKKSSSCKAEPRQVTPLQLWWRNRWRRLHRNTGGQGSRCDLLVTWGKEGFI